ncbi:CDGSH iron-sulfur domain-containing protein 2 [Meles meles]|uniref:CDGSH iron-sulfur domain-containing protein 2 n=1 Tax=Meles meles TaxID=9662 RepID=UPI001E69CC85|nr:CDGSH iron-sulfur domain-containing protein 2 [Meles meles]
MLYLIGHSTLSAGLERLQMGKAQREHTPSSKPRFHGRPPYSSFAATPHLAAARSPLASATRTRHSPAANRRPAGQPLLWGPSAPPPPAHRRTQAAAPAGRFRSPRRRDSSAVERRGPGGEWTLLARMVLESVARIVKVQLPAYLKRLPVPESLTGFARLTVAEWLRLLPFLGVLALLGYLAIRPFLPKKKQQKDSLINLKIQKENPKVVNEINIEDLCLTKAAYCRCWRSKTFPACDGSHNKHNELTGDNVGPLILKKKEV